jgi:hypothetical protein
MKDLALHILDLAENSVSAGATKIILDIHFEEMLSRLTIGIIDNGKGMDDDELLLVEDPFYTSRTTRRVGLGIPLFRQQAEMTGGKMLIRSKKGEGTAIEAQFISNHPDLQPMGDIEGCWVLLVASNPKIEIILKYRIGEGGYEISSKSVMEFLELDSLSGNEIMKDLKSMIRNNTEELSFSVN